MVCLHRLVVIFAAFICCVKGRAVNISNTWVLPEEGFPVFYRYFRDRISWYEADAVCQFHHGNLVTVDTTTQFDAVRAYLKELDIVNNVWIGLTRPSDKTTFSWSGEKPQPLSGEGFWGEASALPGIAVCAAADPAADFRWHALTCGGPEVASFICELPVPPWALGTNGCMLTSLPSLTVIYLPEQTALELTSDCGLDGTKRIACKGNADQQEMMHQLSCGITHEDFDEKAVSRAPMQSTTTDNHMHSSSNSVSNNIDLISSRISSSATAIATAQKAATKPWIWTSNTIDTSEYGSPTRHRRETEDTYSTAGGISLSTTTETTTRFVTAAPFTSNPLPETNRQRPSTKPTEPLTTLKPRLNTLDASSTIETSSTEETPNPGEYPSINQGQLFSIIENGTMFDIIEVNDTSDSDSKMEKTTIKSLIISHGTLVDTLLTTKTPQAITTEFSKSAKGNFNSNKSPNDLSEGQPEKTFMKAIEIEAFPIPSNSSSLVKLNRTNRKELPLLVDYGINATEHTDFKQIDKDFTIPTSEVYPTAKDVTVNIESHQHKIVEITITDIERKTDATKFYVTTKKYDKTRANGNKKKEITKKEKPGNNEDTAMFKKNFTADVNINIEITEAENITDADSNANFDEEHVQIDVESKIADFNNRNATKMGNVNSEDVKGKNLTIPAKLIDDNGEYEEDVIETKDVKTTEEPMEPIPEAQPRPNRNRVLTRPQRRSFYPYFFSRVLG